MAMNTPKPHTTGILIALPLAFVFFVAVMMGEVLKDGYSEPERYLSGWEAR